MKKFKGYTLIELLISIAVFAIAMVSIVAIMSNTLNAYSKSNIDVTIQEDAQIVANQIEEILCDCKSIDKVGNQYRCTSKEQYGDSLYIFEFDSANQKLNLEVNYIESDGSINVANSVLADHVSNFEIKSYDSASLVTSGVKAYNEATFDLELSIKDSNNKELGSYSLSRNVYFRNQVEDNEFNSIKYLSDSGSSSSTTTSGGEYALDVKRYESYNLTAHPEIGIKYFAKDGSNNDIIFYKKNGDGSFSPNNTGATYFSVTSSNTFPGETGSGKPYEGAKTYVLKTTDTVNTNFGNPLGGNTYYVIGYTDKAKTDQVVVALGVKEVKINSSDAVVQVHSSGTVNGEPLVSPIAIDGININEAMKNSVVVKASAWLDGQKFQNQPKQLSAGTGVLDFNQGNLGQWQGGQLNIGIFPDPFDGGVYIGVDNQGGQYISDSGNRKFKFTLNIGGTDVNSGDIKFDKMGTGL